LRGSFTLCCCCCLLALLGCAGQGRGAEGTGGASGAIGTGGGGDDGGGGSGGAIDAGGAAGTGGVISAGTGGNIGVPCSGTQSSSDVIVNLASTHQRMDGFGAADVWMDALTDAQADLFFDQAKGIGLSILRVGIDQNGNNLSQWANAQKAVARGAYVWAAPWSPPASCKDNGSINGGGHLLTTNNCYDSWSSAVAGFAAKFKQNTGAQLWGISAQNEPDFTASYPSCLFSAAQMVAFVKVLGPKLHALSPPVKLLAAEPDVWADLWGGSNGYGNAILNDATAAAQVDVLATHQYANGAVTKPPNGVSKPIWETEASGVMSSTQAGPSSDISNGLAVAKWVHDAIVTGGASAWHYWWLVSLNDDNEGLLLMGGGTTKRLYTVGNFSKFIRPGFVRVDAAGAIPSGVSLTAYTSPSDGTVVVVALNPGSSAANLSVFLTGGSCPTEVMPWVTSSSDSLVSKTAVSLSGARFTATLGAQTVTTFVGKP
jgi:glucuronoarabinoxylan endo-1,4-beta-xylanase